MAGGILNNPQVQQAMQLGQGLQQPQQPQQPAPQVQNYGKPGNPFLAMHQGAGYFNPSNQNRINQDIQNAKNGIFYGPGGRGNDMIDLMPYGTPDSFGNLPNFYGQPQTQPYPGMFPGSYVSGDSIFGPNGNRIGAIGAPPSQPQMPTTPQQRGAFPGMPINPAQPPRPTVIQPGPNVFPQPRPQDSKRGLGGLQLDKFRSRIR